MQDGRAQQARFSEGRQVLGGPVLGRLPDYARQRQSQLLRQRLRSLCAVVAVAVLAWAPVEWVRLERELWPTLLGLRLLLAAGLLGLAWLAPRLRPGLGLGLAFGLQALLLALMRAEVGATGSGWLPLSYALFPFVLAAQVAIFPLSLVAGVLLGLPALALVALPALTGKVALAAVALDLWLCLLILAVAVWASVAQLSLLAELLSARWQAGHDPLTGLANRAFMVPRLRAELARAERGAAPPAVVLLDLDRFKQINDQWGHETGDRVLEAVGRMLRAQRRGGDEVARWGGEEFLLLLPGTTVDEAILVAERLRRVCHGLHVEGAPDLPVRASFGVAGWRPGDTPESLIRRADQALYVAKRSGRDRVQAAVDPA
ncbi:MAG: hypothetical protein KatS3mg126_0577 [Lysobacteraceae bacterium]|nr:MAG: hypothetical protein KatS3mg126_0577 [Xanthomonadaceae bacterium]